MVETGAPRSQLLFDNLNETSWDSDPTEMSSTLDFDLGAVKPVGSAEFAQVNRRWNGILDYEWKSRADEKAEWRTLFKSRGPILA